MMYGVDGGVPPLLVNDPLPGDELLMNGYNPAVNSCTRSTTQEGAPDMLSVSFSSVLMALLTALLTSFRMMRLSMVKAATSTACSASGPPDDGTGEEDVDGGGFPNREANELVRREPLCAALVRWFGRGGSGGFDVTCGGRGREDVCDPRVKVGYV